MEFARKQLEKYGWSDGKGLGKHENGISQPLKPKLKRSITGVGYDAAADFTEHWWSTLYNKAASNVEVQDVNGKTKKIKTKDSAEFVITNSTWRLNKNNNATDNPETQSEYSNNFVRTAVLTNGGSKTQKLKDSDSEDDVQDTKISHKLTDEELFAACEGRTAHKGARHGLKALGKLARIEQQEQILLQQVKYNGYSQNIKHKSKNEAVVEQINLNDECDIKLKKKKKKKKHCNSESNISNTENIAEESEKYIDSDLKRNKEKHIELDAENDSNINLPHKKKNKKRKLDLCNNSHSDNEHMHIVAEEFNNVNEVENYLTLNKKKKKLISNNTLNESVGLSTEEVVKRSKKNKIK